MIHCLKLSARRNRPLTKRSVNIACAKAKANRDINRLEAKMAKMPSVDLPLNHVFTPGLYTREIFMPAGTFLTSKIHKTEHPFVISKGSITVWTEDGGAVRLTAPHTGITKPGTRRVLYAHEDTIWTTFHVTEETDLDKIEARLIFKHDIPRRIQGELKCLSLPSQ